MPPRPSSSARELSRVFALFLLIGILAAWWTFAQGYTFYYGDAEAHLNIARRIVDTRTPGGYQIGTVWLPLPHLIWAVFAASDSLWHSGLAGVIPSVACFALAGAFLFLAARRVFDSRTAAWTVALLFALNPNMLYLQSTPMTEPIMVAAMGALLWATVWFRDSQTWAAIFAAAAASTAASLTRYEGWFLIPFVSLYLLWIAKDKWHAVAFGALAALGPLAWLAHNQYYYSNALEFYNGPYSAIAIYQRQVVAGMQPHPGNGDFLLAAKQYWTASRDVVGLPLLLIGIAGLAIALIRRESRTAQWWPVLFLTLPAAFYVWSIHSSATPIFVKSLPPFSLYNTRYAIPMLLATAFGAGALVQSVTGLIKTPLPGGAFVSILMIALVSSCWIWQASGSEPVSVCWQEAKENSQDRRHWIDAAAQVLIKAPYQMGEGILFSFGDMAGVLRRAGIPFRQGLYQDNGVAWDSAVTRPEYSFHEGWALAMQGDTVDQTVERAVLAGAPYRLLTQIHVGGEPVVKIWHFEPNR